MANNFLILGKSGSGKTSSIRNLDSKQTAVIQTVKKRLPNNAQYSAKNKNRGLCTTFSTVKGAVNKLIGRKEIKNIILDDFQFLMAFDLMEKRFIKGYDKFTEIGYAAKEIITLCADSDRDDLNVFFMWHLDHDENGEMRVKTLGRMLESWLGVASLFDTVIIAQEVDGKYMFKTKGEGAKIPFDFKDLLDDEIDNDLDFMIKKINGGK